MSKQNFSSKFQLWAKMIAAPPRAIHIQKFWTCGHVQNLSKRQKTSLALPGTAFDSYLSSPANSDHNIHSDSNWRVS